MNAVSTRFRVFGAFFRIFLGLGLIGLSWDSYLENLEHIAGEPVRLFGARLDVTAAGEPISLFGTRLDLAPWHITLILAVFALLALALIVRGGLILLKGR